MFNNDRFSSMFRGFYNDKRVLVTGHTGFKGAWLSLWLKKLGAKVTGLALPAPFLLGLGLLSLQRFPLKFRIGVLIFWCPSGKREKTFGDGLRIANR